MLAHSLAVSTPSLFESYLSIAPLAKAKYLGSMPDDSAAPEPLDELSDASEPLDELSSADEPLDEAAPRTAPFSTAFRHSRGVIKPSRLRSN